MKYGNNNIVNCYVGTTQITKVMYADEVVWENIVWHMDMIITDIQTANIYNFEHTFSDQSDSPTVLKGIITDPAHQNFEADFEFANISDDTSTANTLKTYTPIVNGDNLIIVLDNDSINEVTASGVTGTDPYTMDTTAITNGEIPSRVYTVDAQPSFAISAGYIDTVKSETQNSPEYILEDNTMSIVGTIINTTNAAEGNRADFKADAMPNAIAGDLAIIFYTADGGGLENVPGWTIANENGTGSLDTGIYTKILTSSDVSWDCGASGPGVTLVETSAVMIVLKHCKETIVVSAPSDSKSENPDSIELSGFQIGNMAISFAGIVSVAAAGVIPPSGYTLAGVANGYEGTTGTMVAYKISTAIGSEDPGAFTTDISGDWIAVTAKLEIVIGAGQHVNTTRKYNNITDSTGSETISPKITLKSIGDKITRLAGSIVK